MFCPLEFIVCPKKKKIELYGKFFVSHLLDVDKQFRMFNFRTLFLSHFGQQLRTLCWNISEVNLRLQNSNYSEQNLWILLLQLQGLRNIHWRANNTNSITARFCTRKNGIKKNKNFFVRLILVSDGLIFGHFKLVRIFYAILAMFCEVLWTLTYCQVATSWLRFWLVSSNNVTFDPKLNNQRNAA